MNLGEFLVQSGTRIARSAIERLSTGDIRTVGELDEYIDSQLGDVLDTVGSVFSGQAISDLTQPAVQKAIDTMKPAIMQALQDYTPTFAAVAGGMLALAVLLGVWVSKETFQRVRR